MTQMIARALRIGAGLSALVAAQQAVAATTPATFTTSGGNNTLVASKTFTPNAVNGKVANINVSVTAWHGTDLSFFNVSKVSQSQLGLYSPGLGDWSTGDGSIKNDHQVDDYNGFDLLALQFDQNVTLSSISRVVFQLGNINSGSSALWFADTAGTYANANYKLAPNLSLLSDSIWGTVDTKGNLNTDKSASLWLIAADFRNCDYDGFKLAGFTVTTPTKPSGPPTSAVPEPASWAMMIGGFGLIGGALRRRPRTSIAFG